PHQWSANMPVHRNSQPFPTIKAAMPSMPHRSLVSPAFYWLGFALLIAGFLVNGLWRGIARGPTLFLGALLLASLVLAVVVLWRPGWRMARGGLRVWLLGVA